MALVPSQRLPLAGVRKVVAGRMRQSLAEWSGSCGPRGPVT
jgi:hypothetical protein